MTVNKLCMVFKSCRSYTGSTLVPNIELWSPGAQAETLLIATWQTPVETAAKAVYILAFDNTFRTNRSEIYFNNIQREKCNLANYNFSQFI